MNLGVCTFCGQFGELERAHIDSSNKIMLCSSCHRKMDLGEKPKPSGKIPSRTKTKGDVIRKIIQSKEDETTYKEIKSEFEEKTRIEVSLSRVKQVAIEMSKEEIIEIKHEVSEKGNAVSKIVQIGNPMRIRIDGDLLDVPSEELRILKVLDKMDLKGRGLKSSLIAAEIFGYEDTKHGYAKRPSGRKIGEKVKYLHSEGLIENRKKGNPAKWRLTGKGRKVVEKATDIDLEVGVVG